MNNENPIEEAKTTEPSDNMDFRRRRLVRGAIGVAPVVLTLRSGALAASSCVGTKAIATIQSNGRLNSFLSSSAPLVDGDKCVTPIYQDAKCATPKIITTPTIPPSSVTGTVSNAGTGGVQCSGTYTSGQTVAIVSASVTSFV